MAPIELYYMPGSAPCRAVMLAARNIGVELNLKLVNLMARDHLKPEFVSISPQHTIPAINDNGFHLYESRAILQYLANAYSQADSIYPKDPKGRAVVDQRLLFDQNTLYRGLGDVYYPVIFQKETKLDPIKLKKCNQGLQFLEGFLEKADYVAGNSLTIADFGIIATLSTAEAVGHDLSPYSAIDKYMSKCKAEIKGYHELNQVGASRFGEFAKNALRRAKGEEGRLSLSPATPITGRPKNIITYT